MYFYGEIFILNFLKTLAPVVGRLQSQIQVARKLSSEVVELFSLNLNCEKTFHDTAKRYKFNKHYMSWVTIHTQYLKHTEAGN